jgi:hypothetical protein
MFIIFLCYYDIKGLNVQIYFLIFLFIFNVLKIASMTICGWGGGGGVNIEK